MDAAKEYLRKTDASGVSVYSHLTEVLATLLARQPANALDMLEGVSLECKSKHYSKDAAEVAPAPPEVPASVEPSAWAAANDTLVKGYAPAEGDASGQVTDVVYEKSLFACAGVGLSESETFRVYASLVALQRAKDLASVRFFGKVLACGPSDYYVAEAVYNTPPEPEEGEPPPPPPGAPVEASGEGCNKYVYFVASDPSGEWVALPDVTPQQIVSSKRIRKFLTGDLEADVKAYPPFPGQEKAYLRAMIARIVAETTLCPAGAFAPAEEAGAEPTPVEVGAEEGQRPPIAAAALGAAGGWVTRYMGVLDIGRCTNEVLEEQVDDEGNPLPKPYQQPEIPALSPAAASAWSCDVHAHGGPEVAVARSTKWPGAYCAYQLARDGKEATACLYIGYGHEALGAPFKMEAPPPFAPEPDELAEADDEPLDAENARYMATLEEEVAAKAAELPDPAEE